MGSCCVREVQMFKLLPTNFPHLLDSVCMEIIVELSGSLRAHFP